jgi:hypothetical protein
VGDFLGGIRFEPFPEQFHDYYARFRLSQVGLFLVKSSVGGIFSGWIYRETAQLSNEE